MLHAICNNLMQNTDQNLVEHILYKSSFLLLFTFELFTTYKRTAGTQSAAAHRRYSLLKGNRRTEITV